MSWVMQLKLKNGVGHPNGEWKNIQGSGLPEPYRYDSQEEARRMLEICSPDQCREARLGAEPIVRVVEET